MPRADTIEHTGDAIAWTTIKLITLDTKYFVREFSQELKHGDSALTECSRWLHRLQDMLGHVLDSICFHVAFSEASERIILEFRSNLAEFVTNGDRNLGVSLGRVVNQAQLNGAGSAERIAKVVSDARDLVTAMDDHESGLRALLPATAIARVTDTRTIIESDPC